MCDRHLPATFILTTHLPAGTALWGTELGDSQKSELWFLQESTMYPCLGPDLGQYAKFFWEFGPNCNCHSWWLPASENLLQRYGCWTFGKSGDKEQAVGGVLPQFEGDAKDSRTGAVSKRRQKRVQSNRQCLFKIPNTWWNQTKTGVLLTNVKHT